MAITATLSVAVAAVVAAAVAAAVAATVAVADVTVADARRRARDFAVRQARYVSEAVVNRCEGWRSRGASAAVSAMARTAGVGRIPLSVSRRCLFNNWSLQK